MNTIPRIITAILIAVAIAPVALGNHHVSVDKQGVILNGYDTVAYFTEGKAVKGKKDITAKHNGATYRFSSTENRDLFRADPEKYAPQYGGFCAYGAALGQKIPVNGKVFEIVEDKLYVNVNNRVARRWRNDREQYIEDADKAWSTIKEIPAKELK